MRCRNCVHCAEDAVSGYFGGSLYWITHCNYLPHRQKLVDADVERECENAKTGTISSDPSDRDLIWPKEREQERAI